MLLPMISASSLPAFSASASAGSIRSQTATATSAATSAAASAARDAASARGRASEQTQRVASLSDLSQSKPAQSLPRGSLVNVQA